MTGAENAGISAVELVGETLTELATLAETMPMTTTTAAGAEKIAGRLDRLSEDLAEAAELVRQAAAREQRFLP